MAKKTTNVDTKTTEKDDKAVSIRSLNKKMVSFRIEGTSPMIQHKFSEKAKEMMRQKHQGKKTRNRDVRDPEQESYDATYITEEGYYAIPGMGLKAAILSAAHRDIGIPRTLVSKALFLHNVDGDMLIPIDCDEPVMREDPVTVGSSTDLRYRPCFYNWTADVTFEVDMDQLQEADLLNLTDRAGFGVGLCEWRPEKGGEYGRFRVDRTHNIEVKDLDE